MERVAVAFSAGVDSTLLLAAAAQTPGVSVTAVSVEADWVPRRERREAEEFCESRGIRHIRLKAWAGEIAGFAENPRERCYLCKKVLFAKITDAARAEGIAHVLEGSNVDDCSGETLGYAMERLLEAGARDVYFTPIYMKKCRPAYKISVLCQEPDIRRMEEILFRETTTIGIRRCRMSRSVLKREIVETDTSLGKVQVKICFMEEGMRQYPEYESLKKIASETGLPYREVYRIVMEEMKRCPVEWQSGASQGH